MRTKDQILKCIEFSLGPAKPANLRFDRIGDRRNAFMVSQQVVAVENKQAETEDNVPREVDDIVVAPSELFAFWCSQAKILAEYEDKQQYGSWPVIAFDTTEDVDSKLTTGLVMSTLASGQLVTMNIKLTSIAEGYELKMACDFLEHLGQQISDFSNVSEVLDAGGSLLDLIEAIWSRVK